MSNFKLNKVFLNYQKDENSAILKNITIDFPEKGIIGITGASGSGKSSLLHVMAGLKNNLVKGEIMYGKKNILTCTQIESAHLRRNEFGLVFQKHYLIPYLTVYENVIVSSGAKCKKEAVELLKQLGVDKYRNKRITELSGGECQRVAIARALSHSPKVVFADEPTAALDRNNADNVMKIFKEHSKERLFFVVTHDTNLFLYFDITVALVDGVIKEIN